MRHGFTLIAGGLVMGLVAWLFGSQSGHEVLELRKAGLSSAETDSSLPPTLGVPELAARAAAAPDALRVLFVGNSHTYENNMPELVAALAHVAGQRPLYVQMIARGGARIQDHVSEGHASAALSAGGWNALVLQEQHAARYCAHGELTARWRSDPRARHRPAVARSDHARRYAPRAERVDVAL